MTFRRRLMQAALAAFVGLFAACGGGGDDNDEGDEPIGIGAAGGAVTGPIGAQVVVPANALTSNVDIAIAQSAAGAPALPAGRTAIGAIFAFTPHGTSFAQPANVTVPFDAANLPAGETPQLWKTNAAQSGWEALPGATVNAGSMSAQVSSLSWFVVTKATVVAPSLSAHPADVSVQAGQSASFSVTAAGTAPLAYQWRLNGAAIAGATTASYTTPALSVADSGGQYSVVVSNSAGSVTSNNASVTVQAVAVAPAIGAQPATVTVTAGATASFSVAATGTAPLAYQWRLNGAPIAGATSASYTTPATTLADNGAQFSVVVSNSAGSATSNAATLTVNAPPSGAAGNPTLLASLAGENVVGMQSVIDANGRATLVWQRNQLSTLSYRIEVSRSSADGLTWSPAERLDTAVANGQRSLPSIALAGNGDVFVAWVESGGSTGVVVRRFAAATGAWGTPHRIDGAAGGAAETETAIAADANGNAVMLFGRFVSGFARTLATRYDAASGAWSTEAFIESYSSPDQDSVRHRVTMDSSGNALAVWARQNALFYDAVYSRYTAATNTWSTVGGIDSRSGIFHPRFMGLADSGNALLMTDRRVHRLAGSTWSLMTGLLPTTIDAGRMVTQPDGAAMMVVHTDLGGGNFGLQWRRFDPAAATWSAAQTIPGNDPENSSFALAGDANGNAVAFWRKRGAAGTSDGVEASRFSIGSGTWGAVQRVSASATANARAQTAAMNAAGRAALGWSEAPTGASAYTDAWGNVLAP